MATVLGNWYSGTRGGGKGLNLNEGNDIGLIQKPSMNDPIFVRPFLHWGRFTELELKWLGILRGVFLNCGINPFGTIGYKEAYKPVFVQL